MAMSQVAILAVMADRFDCLPPIARWFKGPHKFKWTNPGALSNHLKDHTSALHIKSEEYLRQKILVSYLMDQPLHLLSSTRELVTYGSCQWVGYEEDDNLSRKASWWDLPDGLEAELAFRRYCILRTISSLVTYFLDLYTSRDRKCKLGYGNSAACDSFQLGEMIKFFSRKRLVSLTPATSPDAPNDPNHVWPEALTKDINYVLATLRQCPTYQIDENHKHCGLWSKLYPRLEYIQSMLRGNIGISLSSWKDRRESHTWTRLEAELEKDRKVFIVNNRVLDTKESTFEFRKRGVDPRFRVEDMMIADRLARELFMAVEWDWTAEDTEQMPAEK